MGQAILYCYRCSTQLRDAQFEQGKAFRIEGRVCCSECAPEAVRTLPPDLVQQLLSQLATGAQRPTPPAAPILRTATPRQAIPAHRARQPGRSNLWIGVGIGAAVLGAVAIAAVALSGSSPEAMPERIPPQEKKIAAKPPSSPQPPPPASAGDSPAKQALATARQYAREHPDDFFGQLGRFEDLTLQADTTAVGADARKEAQALRARGKEAVDRALAAFDKEIAGPLSREEFGAVIDAIGAAKTRMDWPEGKLLLDNRERDLRKKVDHLYEPLKAKASEDKAKGDAASVQSTVARVRGWRMNWFIKDLCEALSLVAAPPVRVALQDFEGDPTGWGYVGGQEFPGAKGSAGVDGTVAHGGRRAYKLEADFTGGGAYVGLWCDLAKMKERDVQEIRFWLKTSTVAKVGVRLADGTGQIHQKNGGVALKRTGEWQEVVLRVRDLVGGEHWGGANDGLWHGPAKGFGLNVGKDTFTSRELKQGVLWIDDVELAVVPSSQDQ